MGERRSDLEERVQHGAFGAPELKPEERSRYLGEFRERVLVALTAEQVEEPGVYPEVLVALEDTRASMLILRRDLSLQQAHDYIQMAQNKQVAFRRVDSPDLKGDVGLVVVSADAVDQPEVMVPDRRGHLRVLGIPDELINAVGTKICPTCWEKLETCCPQELINYRRITWIERFLGQRCDGCSENKKIM